MAEGALTCEPTGNELSCNFHCSNISSSCLLLRGNHIWLQHRNLSPSTAGDMLPLVAHSTLKTRLFWPDRKSLVTYNLETPGVVLSNSDQLVDRRNGQGKFTWYLYHSFVLFKAVMPWFRGQRKRCRESQGLFRRLYWFGNLASKFPGAWAALRPVRIQGRGKRDCKFVAQP